MSDKSQKTPEQDLMLVLGETPDGDVLGVRSRGDELSPALLSPVEEGQPLHGELVRLERREDSPVLFDVESLYTPDDETSPRRAGPARISSPAYKLGWDRVFGGNEHASSKRD